MLKLCNLLILQLFAVYIIFGLCLNINNILVTVLHSFSQIPFAAITACSPRPC